LQTAAGNGDTRAILWGLAAMIAVVVLLDQLVWRPVIVWADKFKFEQVESAGTDQPALLRLIGRAAFVIRGYRFILRPIINWLTLTFAVGARRAAATFSIPKQNRSRTWLLGVLAATVLVGLGFAVFHGARELSDLHREDYFELLRSAGITFLRVMRRCSWALCGPCRWAWPSDAIRVCRASRSRWRNWRRRFQLPRFFR
jgi:NitT/TauT family transport system permease protein